jgi:hypothetical protein
VANSREHSNEPSIKDGYFLTSWAIIDFEGRILLHGVSQPHQPSMMTSNGRPTLEDEFVWVSRRETQIRRD